MVSADFSSQEKEEEKSCMLLPAALKRCWRFDVVVSRGGDQSWLEHRCALAVSPLEVRVGSDQENPKKKKL